MNESVNAGGNNDESASDKRSVSAPKELFEAAEERMKERLIGNFSEYVRALIREDLSGRLAVARKQEAA